MKRFSLAVMAALLIANSASACDINAAQSAADTAQNYARRAAYAGEQARETGNADSRNEDTQAAIDSARRAEAAAADITVYLMGCKA